jgi:NitT/TauT family transport system ATP-binding protein
MLAQERRMDTTMSEQAIRQSYKGAVVEPEQSVPAIRVDHVSHAFSSPDGGLPVLALDSVTFDVPTGQFIALVGASGCGKTTVLNMAAGLLLPLTGTVELHGEPISGPSRRTGYMFARDGLLPWRTVRRNVEIGLELRGVEGTARSRQAVELLRLVGLTGFENAYIWQLSQGMRQRVALARTLAIDPDTLLMDEPFAALDAQTKITLQAEFLRIWQGSGKTVMFVTHDLGEAVALADRIIVLSSRPGRIHADFAINLPRPRDSETIRFDANYMRLHEQVWQALKTSERLRDATP